MLAVAAQKVPVVPVPPQTVPAAQAVPQPVLAFAVVAIVTTQFYEDS